MDSFLYNNIVKCHVDTTIEVMKSLNGQSLPFNNFLLTSP